MESRRSFQRASPSRIPKSLTWRSTFLQPKVDWKRRSEIAWTFSNAVAIVGIVCGGLWFLEQRLSEPNIKLNQKFTQRPVDDGSCSVRPSQSVAPHEPCPNLLTLDISATNIGKVGVILDEGNAELLQINPPWKEGENRKEHSTSFTLWKMTLNPGETDHALFQTVTVPANFRTLQVHSQYLVPTSQIGWHLWRAFQPKYWSVYSAVDLGPNQPREQSDSSAH